MHNFSFREIFSCGTVGKCSKQMHVLVVITCYALTDDN